MALRFAAAASVGMAFGAFMKTAQAPEVPMVHARESLTGVWVPSRDHFNHPDDLHALDVQREFQAAQRKAALYDDHEGEVKSKGVLNYKFQPLRLGEIISLSEETAIFRFLLPKITDEFIMEPCSTLQAQVRGAGVMLVEQVQRMYTPITPNRTKGYFDILVKKQPQGRMSEHLWTLKVGDQMNFRIIMHKLKYYPNVYENVGMIGTGSGITPLLQVLRHSIADPEDKTKMQLLFANPTDQRVLLKGTLDDLAAQSNGRFTPYYTVDRVVGKEPWQGFLGLIDENKIRMTMPPPGSKNILLVCGSDQLMNNLCGIPFAVMKPWSSGLGMQPAAGHGAGSMAEGLGGVLGRMGYRSDHVYRF